MERLAGLWQQLWREDLLLREDLGRSGSLLLATTALVVPFGWVFLLLRLRPVRMFLRSWLRA
jgi:hypothetical protein